MNRNTLHKLFHWEHWPTFMFYVPNLPYSFYLATKAKHTAFFSAVNPCIKSSGNGTESKYTTIKLVPKKHQPKTVLCTVKMSFEATIELIKKENISYPLIAKPDVGFRGILVKKITSENELKSYLKKYPIPFIIQEFLDYKNECGIFYHRLPNKNKGTISSITLKRFLAVIGDGTSSLKTLILADKRAKLYLDLFEKIHQKKLQKIPKKGKKIKLTAVGNHSKGTEFINGNHLISKQLESVFDTLSNQISGWYYGRVDVKYDTFKDLENGDFKILEINGIISEPTHIYDANKYTYLKALKAIRTHWKYTYQIAKINHNENNIPYKSTKKFIDEMLELRAYSKMLKKLIKQSF